MKARSTRARALAVAPLGLAALALLLFGVLPLAALAYRAFVPSPGAPATLAPALAALGAAETWRALGATCLVAGATTALAVALGVPLALLTARTDLPARETFRSLLSLPYALPPYVFAVAWIALANPSSGLLNRALRAGLGVEGAPLDVYGAAGIALVLAGAFYPVVLITTHAALAAVDPALEEAARMSGARPPRVLREITLPLVTPAVGAAALLVFLATAASFGVPYLLGTGGTRRVQLLTTAIYDAVGVGRAEDTARAIVLAALLGGMAAAALAVVRVLGRSARPPSGGKGVRVAVMPLGPLRAPAAGACGLVVLVAVALPLFTLAGVALFSTAAGWSATPTLANVTRVLTHPRVVRAVGNSVLLAGGAATVVVALGVTLAYARARTRLPGRGLVSALVELPYALPGTILGLGFILAFARELRITVAGWVHVRIALLGTPWALMAAYAIKNLAFGVRTSEAALGATDRVYEEAARIAGATPLRAAREILLPLLRPALAGAWLLVFLPMLGEITLSILLFGPSTETVGTVLFELQSYADPPGAAVLATFLACATVLGNLAVKRATGGRIGF